MQASLAVVGSLNMDLVVCAPRIPQAGETIIGSAFHTLPGGKGANQAVAAGRLGAAVAMIGKLYGIEREHKGSTDEVRYAVRQEKSNAALDELHDWMEKQQLAELGQQPRLPAAATGGRRLLKVRLRCGHGLILPLFRFHLHRVCGPRSVSGTAAGLPPRRRRIPPGPRP